MVLFNSYASVALSPPCLDLVILSSLPERILGLHNLTSQLDYRHWLMYLTPWTTTTVSTTPTTTLPKRTVIHYILEASQPASPPRNYTPHSSPTRKSCTSPVSYTPRLRLFQCSVSNPIPPRHQPHPHICSNPSRPLKPPLPAPPFSLREKDSHLSPRLPPQPIHMPVEQQRREQRPAQQDEVARYKAVRLLAPVPQSSFSESSHVIRAHERREKQKANRELGGWTYNAVDLATFPNMTRYCGGYVFGLALVLDERAEER
jgi:hypothetical protein